MSSALDHSATSAISDVAEWSSGDICADDFLQENDDIRNIVGRFSIPSGNPTTNRNNVLIRTIILTITSL